jgi:hypothetical protein
LSPVENIWQFLRQNHLSNRIFKTIPTSLMPVAPHGTPSSRSQNALPQSPHETGRRRLYGTTGMIAVPVGFVATVGVLYALGGIGFG